MGKYGGIRSQHVIVTGAVGKGIYLKCVMVHLLPLILLSMFFTQRVFPQVVFAWCPEEQTVSPRNGFLEEKKIDLFIYDSRSDKEVALISCSGEAIKKRLVRLITETYTSAEINVVTHRDSGLMSKNYTTIIKIGILQYHMATGPFSEGKVANGERNPELIMSSEVRGKASIKYSVEVIENTRTKTSKVTKDIVKSFTSPPIMDYSRAKDVLNTTFIDANNELILFIDDVFLQKIGTSR